MRLQGFDVETAGDREAFALQPWRVREGTARITCAAYARTDGGSKLVRGQQHEFERGVTYCTWNGVFDVAWLYAHGHDVFQYKWLDVMILEKWYDNSQRTEFGNYSRSLAAAAKRWLAEWPALEKFLDLKANEPEPGTVDEYWELRCKLDALVTVLIAGKIIARLDSRRLAAAKMTMACIPQAARSWVEGIPMASERMASMRPAITMEMQEIEVRLGLHAHFGGREAHELKIWQKSPLLGSPKKLGRLLFDVWKLTPHKESEKTGDPSTDKESLTYLADQDDRVLEILRWRELNTQLTKFLDSPAKSFEYLGSDVVHPAPKLFATYTGRMTYSSKTKNKYPTGVALHQWPRPKDLRKLICAPEGYTLVEFDASGQELRFMAECSRDVNMLRVLNMDKGRDDLHSFTGASLAGMSFDAFLAAKKAGNQAVVGPTGYRYQGKFTNLSNQYRIGAKKLRIKARVDYGMNVDILTAMQWQNAYKSAYNGVPVYWKRAVAMAKDRGYAETFAGRRFGIHMWGPDHEWGSGQSAINFPIQGAGADQKELAIAMIGAKYPELQFAFDLHDGLFFYVHNDVFSIELCCDVQRTLNQLPYAQAWAWDQSIPLTWDCEYGCNWGEMKEAA